MYLCALYLFRCPQTTEETVVFPGIGVTGSCEQPHVCSGSLIWVLCKSSLSAVNCCAVTSPAFTSIFEIYWIVFKMHLYFKINRKLASRLWSENCPSPQYITMPFYLSFTVCQSYSVGLHFLQCCKNPSTSVCCIYRLPETVFSRPVFSLWRSSCPFIFSCFAFLIRVLAI